MGIQEGLNFVVDLANRGAGYDHDGLYGYQCVDLINGYLSKGGFKTLGGNAIDLLNSAKAAGYEVIYDAPGVNPKKGDVYVSMQYAHQFGHTGVVIEDSDGYTIRTVEQNIDGNADALQVGGPARFRTLSFSDNYGKVLGWFRLPNSTVSSASTQATAQASAPKTATSSTGITMTKNGYICDLPTSTHNYNDYTDLELSFDYEAADSVKKFRINRVVTFNDGSTQWNNMIYNYTDIKGKGNYKHALGWVKYNKSGIKSIRIHLNYTEGSGAVTIKNLKIRELKTDFFTNGNYALEVKDYVTTKKAYMYQLDQQAKELKAGDKVRLTFDYKAENGAEFQINRVVNYKDGTAFQWNTLTNNPKLIKGEGKYSGEIEWPKLNSTKDNILSIRTHFHYKNDAPTGGKVTIKNFRIEKVGATVQAPIQNPTPTPFIAAVKGSAISAYKDANASSAVTGTVPIGRYTIVETKFNGNVEFGKLKSGLGWIDLTKVTKE